MHWGRYYDVIAANQHQLNKFNTDRFRYNRQ